MPPPKSCNEDTFSVIFMAYDPKKLQKLYKHSERMIAWPGKKLVEDIIVVWNGEETLNTTNFGMHVLQKDSNPNHPLRIFYSRSKGLGNNLLNRYHPDIKPKTEAIMYYDDDGPFYGQEATVAAFELWKRNSNVQVGAMGRKYFMEPRMMQSRDELLEKAGGLGTKEARTIRVPFCRAPPTSLLNGTEGSSETANGTNNRASGGANGGVNDYLLYDTTYYNFGTNMVLPSGSFLHKNYLCFIWHEAFQEVRDFVVNHPCRPDDVMVSIVVSQLSGLAPLVYSRFINKIKTEKAENSTTRRLTISSPTSPNIEELPSEFNHLEFENYSHTDALHRRLLWNDNDALEWLQLRREAVNSISGYFGSINGGSIGWCFGTEYYKANKYGVKDCIPPCATAGQIPWMKEGGYGYDEC
eukprot:CAMPEP_0195507742 /NCGR_PEP_ID=MMETSP0794_2-20130614/1129_1 /TAXON_ID=515487 /ORGANISM="Stephanopyxis turris, Strain CCMP 815" /LENGTH=410 /DNA_ID=CAMNT_0040634525 /DNA_START=545 /DNA_END=1777 /DNA_ORIENTATION=-